MHFYDIKGGRLTPLTLAGHDFGRIYPVGPNIIYATQDRKERAFSKFDGKQFVPVTAQEKDDLMKKGEYGSDSGWKSFGLWDENGQEIEERDAQKPEDDWATFPLKSGPVMIHYRTTPADPKTFSFRHLYSVKGLAPNAGEQELFSATDGTTKIDHAAYENLFPARPSGQLEDSQ
jgi:hypothetical protein